MVRHKTDTNLKICGSGSLKARVEHVLEFRELLLRLTHVEELLLLRRKRYVLLSTKVSHLLQVHTFGRVVVLHKVR